MALSVKEAVGPEHKGSFDWHAAWWPVAFLEDLDKQKPNKFTLLGEPLVIWHDAAGQWRVLRDLCPHRLVPLSEGRVTQEGALQCPYHGWEFNGSGRCLAIPQGGDPASPRACATAYACAAKQGLLWVKPKPLQQLAPPSNGSAATDVAALDTSDIPIIPEEEQGSGWDVGVAQNTWRDFPYDYSTLLENVLDVGHVPFTHHATVSNRKTGVPIDLRITSRGPEGFTGVWEKGPRLGTLGRQETLFKAPSHMRHTIDAFNTKGFSNITAVYAVPTTPGRSRVFVKQPFRFKNPIPRLIFRLMPAWLVHLGNHTVLEDDVIFLHQQEPEAVAAGLATKPVGRVYHMPGASDAYVTAFRSWLQLVGGGGPFGPQDQRWLQAAGPRQAQEDLLERYHSHTANCRACSGALRNVQRARAAAEFASSAAVFLAAVSAAVALGGSALAGAAASSPSALAVSSSSGLLASVGQALLRAAAALLPAGEPALLMASAAALLAVAGGLRLAGGALTNLEQRFITGVYPPPRNVKP